MKYTPMTSPRAARLGHRPLRKYGYVIVIEPPIEHTITGDDVEGIGWVPCKPRIKKQTVHGWYKHKDAAHRRAKELNSCKQPL